MKRVFMLLSMVIILFPFLSNASSSARVFSFKPFGGIAIGEPCPPSMHDACDFKCQTQKKPNEILTKTRCEQTLTPFPNNPIPSLGYDCTCSVIEVIPSAPEPPPQDPNPIEI